MHKPICIIDTCPSYRGYCRKPGHTIPEVKTKKPIAKVSAKKMAKDKEEKDEGADLELKKWFEYVAGEIAKNPTCWNCGAYIPKEFYRHASAHILPKRKDYGFPSVATHKMNFLVLGAGCGCHSTYDRSFDDAVQMPVFPIALERFRLFADFIEESERFRVPSCFYTLIDKNKLK